LKPRLLILRVGDVLRTTRNNKDKAEEGHKGVKALARANKKAGARANKMAREEKGTGVFLPGQIWSA
jgi:hypothetical protein